MSTTHGQHVQRRRSHINAWLLAVSVLTAALVGLGTWVIIDQTSSTTATSASQHGIASSRVATILRDRIAAANGGVRGRTAAFYAHSAVLEEHDIAPPVVTKGNEQIGGRIETLHSLGLKLRSESPVIQLGSYAAEAASLPGDPGTGWILVYELDSSGKIVHQWVIGGRP